MQVVRLVKGGYVDKLIAFDALPERFFRMVEKIDVRLYRLPRYWEKFASHHYVLEYEMVNKDKETWQAITNFLKQVVDKSVRLMDKIEDMALPMAANPKEPVTVEPEDIPVIPIPLEFQEKAPPALVTPAQAVVAAPPAPPAPAAPVGEKCADCGREFSGKAAVRMHRMKKHPRELVKA